MEEERDNTQEVIANSEEETINNTEEETINNTEDKTKNNMEETINSNMEEAINKTDESIESRPSTVSCCVCTSSLSYYISKQWITFLTGN